MVAVSKQLKACFSSDGLKGKFSTAERKAISEEIVRAARGEMPTIDMAISVARARLEASRDAYNSMVAQINEAAKTSEPLKEATARAAETRKIEAEGRKAKDELIKAGADKASVEAMSPEAAIGQLATIRKATAAQESGAPKPGKQEGAPGRDSSGAPNDKAAGLKRGGTRAPAAKPQASPAATALLELLDVVRRGPDVSSREAVVDALVKLMDAVAKFSSQLSEDFKTAYRRAYLGVSDAIKSEATNRYRDIAQARDAVTTRQAIDTADAIRAGLLTGEARISAFQMLIETAYRRVSNRGDNTQAKAEQKKAADLIRDFSGDPDLVTATELVAARVSNAEAEGYNPRETLERLAELADKEEQKREYYRELSLLADYIAGLELDARSDENARAELADLFKQLYKFLEDDALANLTLLQSRIAAVDDVIGADMDALQEQLENARTESARAKVQKRIDAVNAKASSYKVEAFSSGVVNVIEMIEGDLRTSNPNNPPVLSAAARSILARLQSMIANDRALLEAVDTVMVPALVDTGSGMELREVPLSTVLAKSASFTQARVAGRYEQSPSMLRFAYDGSAWRVAQQPNAPTGKYGRASMASEWNDGSKAKDAKKMTVRQLELAVKGLAKNLAVKPRVFVAENQTAFETNFPDVYAAAASAWEAGNFGELNAAGYSFLYEGPGLSYGGVNILENGQRVVLLFSDRIANADHARFVFAHETLGHFGLRALLGDRQFDTVMNMVHSMNDRARSYATVAMAADPKKTKSEAVEEFLADYAGSLETSLLARVWDSIKGFLNRLGLTFGDESVRFLLNQARRYVRTGQKSAVFDAGEVASRLVAMEAHTENSLKKLNAFVESNLAANQMLISGVQNTSIFTTIADLFGARTGKAKIQMRSGRTDLSSNLDYFKKNYLSLFNYSALGNAGLTRFNDLMSEMRDISMRVKVEFNERLRSVLTRAVYGNWGGLSQQDEDNMSSLLYHAREYAARKIQAMNTIEGKTKQRLFDLDAAGRWVVNKAEVDRLKKLASISLEQARKGFDIDIPNPNGGKPLKTRFEGFKDLDETGPVWQGYLKIRDAMVDIELELLRAKYSNDLSERDVTYQELGELMKSGAMDNKSDRELFDTTVAYIRKVADAGAKKTLHGALVRDDAALERANDMLMEINKALISQDDPAEILGKLRKMVEADAAVEVAKARADKGKTPDDIAKLTTSLTDSATQRANDLEAKITDMRSRMAINQSTRFLFQNKVKQAVFAAEMMDGAEDFTKASIAGGYIPIYRDGQAEVRVEARVNGRRVMLKEAYKERLSYSQFEAVSEAENFAEVLNNSFKGKTFEAEVMDPDTGEFMRADVQLVAVAGDALTQVAVHPELNYNEFVRGLRQFDITLAPNKMADVLVALTTQNASARNRLVSSFSPGYDQRMAVTAVSRHIDARAASIAKTYTRARLNELMNLKLGKSARLWYGDKEVVIAKREYFDKVMADPRSNEDMKRDARTAFHTALYQYKTTNPAAKDWDGSRATKDSFSIGGRPTRALRDFNSAAATLAFIDGNRFVDETDFGTGRAASALRSWTGVAQLGGSIAQGALQLLSLPTNWVPYMASYNQKTGFGGGFSTGKTIAEMMKAMRAIGAPGMSLSTRGRELNTAEFYANMAAAAAKGDTTMLDAYGLEAHEAEFIANEIREGVFIPAQFNALAGTSRGAMGLAGTSRKSIAVVQKFVDNFMIPFNTAEAASRRAAGLAAYRLAYKRARAAHPGAEGEAIARAKAREFAVRSVTLTMGEYSVLNRPPAWRNGIQSFLFMYKTYPVTTVQLLANLSPAGKAAMLTALWSVSGLAGLPGAEDLEDILDTIAQQLGFKFGSVRALAARTIDEYFPGMSPIVFKGLLNQIVPIPADVASRMSVGNLIPGTGIFLAGANVTQELRDVAGPAIGGFLFGLGKTVKDLVSLPFSSTVTVQDTLRDSPVTAMRMIGDAWAYTDSGAIVDRRGYIVSKDMGAGTILTRLLGFYPEPAAQQYEIIRLANRITGYQREMTATFRTAWVKAMMTGDAAEAREIAKSVEEWNAATRGTALEIRNFITNSNRALLEARLEASARAKKATPLAARPDIEGLIQAFTD